MPRRLLYALAIVLAVANLACGSVLPKPTKSDFFLLTELEPAPVAERAPRPTILLGPVALPAYLDRPELVTRLGANQLRVEERQLWAEPLDESVSRILERDLGALMGRGRVQQLPWREASPPQLRVAVEVRRFERTAAGGVELAARWSIVDGDGETERLSRVTRLSYPTPGPTTEAAVATMSEALADLSREIAGALRDLERGPS